MENVSASIHINPLISKKAEKKQILTENNSDNDAEIKAELDN